MLKWVIGNIDTILTVITVVMAPILGWLVYERHVQKMKLNKMQSELDAADVSIEQDKFEALQAQINVYSNLIDTIKKHSEEMIKSYDKDYQRLKDKMEEMRQEHERERERWRKEIDMLSTYSDKLEKQLKELREQQ